MNFIVTFIGIFISGSTLFLYCYYAELATHNLHEFGNELFNSTWYELPLEMQYNYILIIANAQKPLNYDGLHMIFLNLPTFSQVKDHLSLQITFIGIISLVEKFG